MASFKIPAVNGTYEIKHSSPVDRLHDLAVDTTGVTAGSLAIRGRKPGATYFEDIPDSPIDLATPKSILIEGSVQEFEFVLTGFAGTAVTIEVTDTSTGGR